MSTSRKFHVVGAGGHGRVVADVIRSAGGEVVGYVDADPEKLGDIVDGHGASVAVLQEELFALLEAGDSPPEWAGAVVGIGDNRARRQVVERIRRAETTTPMPTVVHPTATIAETAELGRGTVVCAHAVVNPGARVGDAAIVNTGAIVEHDVRVGDAAHVAPNATLCGATRVGPRTMIGAGSTVLETLEVGRDCHVGAGATVVDAVADETTVVGVPARPIEP